MRKKKQLGSSENIKNESIQDGFNQEDLLDLDDLLEVQGGKEEQNSANCGLGCFTSAVSKQSRSEQDATSK